MRGNGEESGFEKFLRFNFLAENASVFLSVYRFSGDFPKTEMCDLTSQSR